MVLILLVESGNCPVNIVAKVIDIKSSLKRFEDLGYREKSLAFSHFEISSSVRDTPLII
jgi:hypothetical protein